MKNLPAKLKSPALWCFLLANLIFALLLGMREAGWLQPIELLAHDYGLRLNPARAPDNRVVTIGFTEADIHSLGYPASDELLARILERLTQYQARTIGVDIYRDIPVPPGSGRLDAILEKNPDIIWITQLGAKDGRVAPPKALEGGDQIGFNDMVDDPGGKMRRGLLFMDDGKNSYTSLALQLALHYLAPMGIGLQSDPRNKDWVRLGKTTIVPFSKNDGGYVDADDAGYQFLLDYRGMPKRFQRFSFSELLNGQVDPGFIKDKVVIIGATANSVNDYFYTPFSEGTEANQRIYGAELHGFAVSQLLRVALDGERPVQVFSRNVERAWIWFWVLLGGATGFLVRALWKSVFSAALALSVLAALWYWANIESWWIPLAPPAVGYLLAAGIISAFMAHQIDQHGKFIRKTFGRYMSEEVVEQLLESPGGLNLGGQSLLVTIMFTDLRGFTAISEAHSPERVVETLNDYLKIMTEIVFKYAGTINEFMGDGILILFGAPTMRPDDAKRAVACAIEMQLAMERVNAGNRAKSLPELEMGIGINTGRVVAGNVGSDMRVKYSVIGSSVNMAARVETFTVGGQILVSENTFAEVSDEVRTTNKFTVPFKGIKEPVTIYEIAGIGELSLPARQLDCRRLLTEYAVNFDVLAGKQSSGNLQQGTITHLGKKSAMLATQEPLAPLSNLKIIALAAGEDAGAYAKVLKQHDDGGFEIQFTFVSDEMSAIFDSLS